MVTQCSNEPLYSIFPAKVKTQEKNGNRKKAVFYSDIAFGFSYMAIVTTVLIIVLTYAFGKFPEHTYYDRLAVIGGNRGGAEKAADDVVQTTMEAVVEASTAAMKATTMAAMQATTGADL